MKLKHESKSRSNLQDGDFVAVVIAVFFVNMIVWFDDCLTWVLIETC